MPSIRFTTILIAVYAPLLFTSCREGVKENEAAFSEISKPAIDTISMPVDDTTTVKRPDFIIADLDGDNAQDSVIIIADHLSKKEGLRIIYANKKADTLGMGKEVVGQGFDDISWAGIFEKAPKGNQYAENVDENGEIMTEDQIPADAWITLPNDGIYLHASESCGGGIIYLYEGQYKWIQQE